MACVGRRGEGSTPCTGRPLEGGPHYDRDGPRAVLLEAAHCLNVAQVCYGRLLPPRHALQLGARAGVEDIREVPCHITTSHVDLAGQRLTQPAVDSANAAAAGVWASKCFRVYRLDSA